MSADSTVAIDAGSCAGFLRRAGRAFRHRNYRLFFAGQLVSLAGSWMQTVALAWLVWRLTGSSALLGLLAFCNQGPVFFLGLLAGTVVDRFDRRRLLLMTQTISMLVTLALAILILSDAARIELVIGLSLTLGVVSAFDIPGRHALMIELVGRDDLPNAIALNSATFNGTRLVGPAIGGLLVASVGEGWCSAVNAASYLPVIVGLLRMRLPPSTRPAASKGPLLEILACIHFLRREPRARRLLGLVAICSLAGLPYLSLLPMLASQVLGGGPGGYGILMSAVGVGSLSAAVRLIVYNDEASLRAWPMRAACLFGVTLVLVGLSRDLWLTAALLAPAGFFLMTQNNTANTLLQHMVPDELRGRVMAVYAMLLIGTIPFGALIAGAMADRIGAPKTILGGGAICAVVAMALALLDWRSARRATNENEPGNP